LRRITQISQTLTPAAQVALEPAKQIQGIQVPSSFRLSLRGKTEAKQFGPLSGTLRILPSADGSTNPFYVLLKTDSDKVNGSLYWSSAFTNQTGQKASSRITVNGNQVHLEVIPTQGQLLTDVSWFTLVSGKLGDLTERSPIPTSVKQGTLTFSIQGNSISGKIVAEGTSYFNSLSNYEAEFTGQILQETDIPTKQLQQKQLKVTEKQLDKFRTPFRGTWQVEPFGTIQLQQQEQQVSGTYTARGGGIIHGTVEGNRLDFTWKDSSGEGWGFFRALAEGSTLTGRWGTQTDKTDGKNITATQISSPTSDISQQIEKLHRTGFELLEQHNCSQAIISLQKVLTKLKENRNNPQITEAQKTQNLISEVDIQSRIIGCYYLTRKYDDFLAALDDAANTRLILERRDYKLILNDLVEYIEGFRKDLLSADRDKIVALDKGQYVFQKLIQIYLKFGLEEQALLTAEMAKARAFADLLSTRYAGRFVDSPTLEQIRQIAKTQRATLVEYMILSENKQESELLIWVVKPTGEIAPMRRVNLKSLSVLLKGACQTQLNQPLKSLADVVDKVHCSMRINAYSPNADNTGARLRQLHQLLIEPIADLLPNDSNAQVIFIPHQELFLVPFPALLNAKGKYLVDQYLTLTAPSIQVLDYTRAIQNKVDQSTGNAIVVGNNATFAPEIKIQLNEAENEAKQVARLLNTQAIIGNQATKANVLRQLPQARYIHFSTHGEFKEADGLQSWVALAPSSNDDGLLTAAKISEMRLMANLVVLSACTTGRGTITGDGVLGLSRSFIAAGVPSVVVSLWSVQDAGTTFLMNQFYSHLSSGKAKALQQAMLETKAKYPNQPGIWAAFILIGES
jgi:CHAT domain-containing protein